MSFESKKKILISSNDNESVDNENYFIRLRTAHDLTPIMRLEQQLRRSNVSQKNTPVKARSLSTEHRNIEKIN